MRDAIADDSLIFLDRAENEDDGVVCQSQGLACFPGSKKGVLIDFMLGFGKDSNDGVSPGWVRSVGIGHDDGTGFAGELMKFIVINAVGEENGIESERDIGVQLEEPAPRVEQKMADKDVLVRALVAGS